MVTFQHTDPGTSLATWVDAIADRQPPVLDIGSMRHLLVVAAHPDDETLGAGGLMGVAAAAGIDISVIIATDGERSHPDSPTHTPETLALIRQDEVRRAVAQVAPTARLTLLHLPDGGLVNYLAELTEEIRGHLTEGSWVASPWIEDGHTDHHAAGTAARDATRTSTARLIQYPIWAWHWGHPADHSVPLDRLLQLPLAPDLHTKKQRALDEHRSQLEPLSPALGDETLLPLSIRDFFDQDCEYFVISESNALPVVLADSDGAAVTDDDSLPQTFFDDFYGNKDDPWQFESLWYEQRKRDLTLAVLPRQRFSSAFEPGCSIGVLTESLARRCDHVLAADITEQPLRRAARRLSWTENVELRQLRVPQDWPAGTFDLVVLSEIGYYCGSADLDRLISLAVESLTPDGVLVACHWRHRVNDYPLRGDEVHQRLRAHPGLAILAEHIEEDFLLDVLVRPPAVSVGARDGLA